MRLLSELLIGYLDSLTGHLALAAYLMAVTDERAVWRRLKKLPPLFLSPLIDYYQAWEPPFLGLRATLFSI